jgi:hypothetical protein
MAAAVAGLFAYLRRRRTAIGAEVPALDPDQQARARELLEGERPLR